MDEGNFTVYRSSAGSGKTFTLVREYLQLVLVSPDQFRHILAITFTNRAANEMKERVLSYLRTFSERDLSTMDGTTRKMLEIILKETGLTADEIRSRAGDVLNNILHNYTEFAIGTIDSFTHKITRIFAYDLKLPLNFEVEMDTDRYLTEVINRLIEKVGKDEELTDVLVGFLEQKASEEKSWKIDKDLKQTAKVLLQEGSKKFIDRLDPLSMEDFFRIRQGIYREIAGIESTLRKQANDALGLIGEQGIDPASFSFGTRGLPGYFMKFVQKPMKIDGPNSYVEKTFSEDKWTSGKASDDDRAKIIAIRDELTEIYNRTEKFREAHFSRYNLLKVIAERIYQLTVLNEIGKIIEEMRDDNNIVHISEFNDRISRIVAREPVPFIYERLGEKYRHILIDEFQDTSILQWMNLLPLVENSLAYNQFNMVVGDTKQSIYRFRDGDPDQFENLPSLVNDKDELIMERERVLRQHYVKVELEENFRSSPDIVEFNNEFFGYIQRFIPEEYRSYYDNVKQKAAKDFPGEVSITFLEDDFEENNLMKVLETVRELEHEGFALRDVAILCRANDKASSIAGFLLQEGINVVSSESLLVSASADVRFIINWFRLLYDHNDHVAAAHVFLYLHSRGWFKDSDIHSLLHRLSRSQRNPFREVVGNLSGEGMELSGASLESLGLVDLAEFLVRNFCPDGNADPYLVFFLDVVSSQAFKGDDSLALFLEWWDDHAGDVSIAVPENINAVRVMTIHKAKGLQFPVVIFPFADTRVRTTRDEVWIPLAEEMFNGLPVALARTARKLHDSGRGDIYDLEYNKSVVDFINLLYVVMTRPMEKLYIFTRREEKFREEPGDIQQMLYSFLMNKYGWDPSGSEFSHGRKVAAKTSERTPDEASVRLQPYKLTDWHRRVLLSYSAPSQWEISDPAGHVRWGTLVHLVLSRIKGKSDVRVKLQELVDEGIILPAESEEMLRVIRRVFENKEIESLFDDRYNVVAEREIMDAEGNIHRPDRIIINGKEATIVDFKTGLPRDEHEDQISRYGNLLEEMGYDVKKKFLLYISEKPELRQVE